MVRAVATAAGSMRRPVLYNISSQHVGGKSRELPGTHAAAVVMSAWPHQIPRVPGARNVCAAVGCMVHRALTVACDVPRTIA
eukprot:6983803-Prymnesium_polylepis.1